MSRDEKVEGRLSSSSRLFDNFKGVKFFTEGVYSVNYCDVRSLCEF